MQTRASPISPDLNGVTVYGQWVFSKQTKCCTKKIRVGPRVSISIARAGKWLQHACAGTAMERQRIRLPDLIQTLVIQAMNADPSSQCSVIQRVQIIRSLSLLGMESALSDGVCESLLQEILTRLDGNAEPSLHVEFAVSIVMSRRWMTNKSVTSLVLIPTLEQVASLASQSNLSPALMRKLAIIQIGRAHV